MVLSNHIKWPPLLLDVLFLIRRLVSVVSRFAMMVFALYGINILLLLHYVDPLPSGGELQSITRLLLQVACTITLLAWFIAIFSRSVLPSRWAAGGDVSAAAAAISADTAKAWSTNSPMKITLVTDLPRTSAGDHWSSQAGELLQVVANAPDGDHPRLDGPVEHMHHWLKMREHPLEQCSLTELGTIMLEAQDLRDHQAKAPG